MTEEAPNQASSSTIYFSHICEAPQRDGRPKLTKDRLQIDLDCGEQHSATQSMRDHGSRSCDVLVAYDALEPRQKDDFNASCATSTCRRIDLHELELFVENEPSVSIETTEICRPATGSVDANIILRIDKLAAGEEILVEPQQVSDNNRTIVLNMQDSQGNDRWWKVSWGRRTLR